MTDNSMIPDSSNADSAPNDQTIARRVSLWGTQRAELAAMISPSTDYKHLIWNVLSRVGAPGVNEKLMFAKECFVAQRILDWLDEHPEYAYYRDYIKLIPYDNFTALEETSTIHFNLWMNCNASMWISTRDAANHRDALWQLAVMRVSAYLNTGSFTPAAQQLR
jgi:hypothetical protein